MPVPDDVRTPIAVRTNWTDAGPVMPPPSIGRSNELPIVPPTIRRPGDTDPVIKAGAEKSGMQTSGSHTWGLAAEFPSALDQCFQQSTQLAQFNSVI